MRSAIEKKVVIKEFSTRVKAEEAQMLLSGSGIEAVIEADDCGGVHHGLAMGRGVYLLVAEKDEERARELLDLQACDRKKAHRKK